MIILDASITVAWLLNEPDAPALELNAALATNHAAAPSHWPIEVGNALLTAMRRRRIDLVRCENTLAEVESLDVMIEPVTSIDRLPALLALAESQRLTLYDAIYVDLAASKLATLATLDRAMRTAAHALNIDVLPI